MKRSAKSSEASKNPLSRDSKGSALPGKLQQGKQEQLGDLAAGLYLTATPIGHAQDISLRALDILARVDQIAAEDTRVTSKLLAIHGISKPLTPYNDHNAAKERPRLVEKLKAGGRIALVSDAGTPLVSDPGFKLARAAIAEGIAVHAIPGASAVLTGLCLSGLPSDRFLFAGFLPSKSGERRTALEELKSVRATLIFFESVQRLDDTLSDMLAAWGGRDAAVARELTKLHEEVRRGTLAELADHYAKAGAPKGEVTLLVGPPHEVEADFAKIEEALEQALPFMPLKAASDLIAGLTGAPRKQVYDLGLKKKNAQGQ
jgi:16S rRNA (cytidine1402-2'-O)-methyltransferase